MNSPNDPFGNGDGKFFRNSKQIAGFTVAVGAAAAVIAIGLTQGGNQKKPKPNPVARIAPPVRTGNVISLQEPVGVLLQAHPLK